MRFEWDRRKASANQRKHGLTFEEAKQLFTSGVDYLEIHDEEHSLDEDRFLAVGPIQRGVIIVAYADLGDDVIRIVSARVATKHETRRFEEYWRGRDE